MRKAFLIKLHSIQATRGVETLILKSSHPLDKHSILLDDGFKGRESSTDTRDGGRPGNTSFFIPKLMHAVVLFIAQSLSLHTVIMESMWIQADLLESFGHALSSTKSGRLMCEYVHSDSKKCQSLIPEQSSLNSLYILNVIFISSSINFISCALVIFQVLPFRECRCKNFTTLFV